MGTRQGGLALGSGARLGPERPRQTRPHSSTWRPRVGGGARALRADPARRPRRGRGRPTGVSGTPPHTPEAPPGPAGAAEAPARAPPRRMLGPPTPGPAMVRAGLAPQRLLLREPRPPWPPRRPRRPARPHPGPQRTPAWRPPTRSPPWAPDGRTDVECDRPRSSSASSAPTESGNRSSNQRRPTWPRPLPAWCFLGELRAFPPR